MVIVAYPTPTPSDTTAKRRTPGDSASGPTAATNSLRVRGGKYRVGFLSALGGLSSCQKGGDFAEAANVDGIAGLASISSRTSTTLNAGGIVEVNGCTAARTFETENKQKRHTTSGLTLDGQRRIDGER